MEEMSPQQPPLQPAPMTRVESPAAAPRPAQPGLRRKIIPRPRPQVIQPGFSHYLLAAAGSVLVGVTLPSLLTALRLCLLDRYADSRLGNFIILQTLALFGAGPGAVVLSLILMSFLVLKTNTWEMKKAITTGAFSGIGIAFLNLPGYCVFVFLWDDNEPVLAVLRVGLLFVVAGVTCGMWIGWQAWKGFRPKEGFLPRFTLKTLLMMVMLWGSVLIAFQPDRTDEEKHWQERQAAKLNPVVVPAQNEDER